MRAYTDQSATQSVLETGPEWRLAMAVLWAASRDEAMVVAHLVNIGRRDTAERTAHFLILVSEFLSSVWRAKKAMPVP